MGVKAGNMHYRLRDIQARHWQGLAAAVSGEAWHRLLAMARSVDAALSQVEAELQENFPAGVWTTVAAGVRRHATVFFDAAQTAP
jgi:serine/threonine-protein kinase HipA